MKVATIQEANKLIQMFIKDKKIKYAAFVNIERLDFLYSWDALMPVVKEIINRGCLLSEIKYQTAIINSLQTANIDHVYISVVDFIKTYYENNTFC